MRRLCFAAILQICLLLAVESGAEDESPPKPGEVSQVSTDVFGEPLPVWIPAAHSEDEKRRWPVFLYYHGTNGSPNLRFAIAAAGQSDWIVIGMTYQQKGRFSYGRERLQVEIDSYQKVLEDWNERFSLRLDPQRVFVGGFSKGGWLSGLFLEEDPRIAGAVVMGAGRADRADFDPSEISLTGKPVYFGLGESDGNVAMSYRGRLDYEAQGATVTWDLWEGLGHSVPARVPESLRQWFRLAGRKEGSQVVVSEALGWLESEKDRLEQLEHPAKRWEEWEILRARPYYSLADEELRKEFQGWREVLSKTNEVPPEVEARDRFFEILRAEAKNRYVETLRKAHEEYGRLANESPNTYWGQKAKVARERTGTLLP